MTSRPPEYKKRRFDYAKFRARLHSVARPRTDTANARKLTQKVIEESLDAVAEIVGVSSVEIGTVRERSGFREQRLRHVYAHPKKVREWFDTKDREWFDTRRVRVQGIERLAFDDPSAKYACDVPLGGSTCYCVAYDIEKNKVRPRNRKRAKKNH